MCTKTEAYKGSNQFWVQEYQCLPSFLVWDWRYRYKVVSELCRCFNNCRDVVISLKWEISWKTNLFDIDILTTLGRWGEKRFKAMPGWKNLGWFC